MKKFLVGLFILSCTTLFAQDNRNDQNRNMDKDNKYNNGRPDEVRRSFERDYPNAQNPQWNNSNGQWHASFRDQNNKNIETHYDNYGRRIDTHTPYDQNEFPGNVRDRADRRYNTNGNYNGYRIDRPDYEPLFQLKIQSGRTIYMNENGEKRRYKDRH